MTIYKCRRGCTFELDDDIADNDPALDIVNPGVRAYCAFCEHKDRMLLTWDDEAKALGYSGETCTWLREDESWEAWDTQQELEWDDEEEEELCTGECSTCRKTDEWQEWDA